MNFSLRLAQLFVGLLLYGIACAFMVLATVGVDPWTVFAQGLSTQTGLSLGLLTILVGAVVLLAWIPLKQRPGLGTVLNILLVGPSIDLGLWLLPAPSALWLRIGYFAVGLLLLSVATGVYVGAGLGPGPRDGLMTGLNQRFRVPIWAARTSVEVTVLIIGWLLGGDAWIGTVAFALLIGPLCGITLPLFARKPRASAVSSPEGRAPRREEASIA